MKFNWNFLIIPLKLLNYLELKPCENHLTSKSLREVRLPLTEVQEIWDYETRVLNLMQFRST